MNPTLRNLLVFVAVVVGGAGTVFTVLTPKAGVNQADLVAAGALTDCQRRDRVCQVQFDDGGYGMKRLDVLLCPGNEVVLPRKWADSIGDLAAWCKPISGTSTLAAGAEADEPFDCACRVNATCLVGGQPAPVGITLAPGTWSGAGCQAKPCVEISGNSSWPVVCPP